MLDYITGEKLQELTDHTIVLYGQEYVTEQLKNINTPFTYFNPNIPITELSENIQNAKSLYVYIHKLDFFFNNIYPLRKKPFILMTHNYDSDVTEKYQKFLDDPKIIKWFSVNVNYQHPKLISIPIGIANSQWPHGNLNILEKIRNENNHKTMLVYKNFDISTAVHRRQHVHEATDRNGIYMAPRKPHIEYLRDISKSYFTICPMGNGIDSHRVWESLYLNTIPIVPDCIHFQGFKELPILPVINGEYDNWQHITIPLLQSALEKMSKVKYDNSKLRLEYWKKQIKHEPI